MIWIAFLRGINVGGNNILPMKDLSAILEKTKCLQVKTYIQSGNVVFKSSETNEKKMALKIEGIIFKQFKIQSRVLMIRAKDLEKAAAKNPFPGAIGNPKTLHLSFLFANLKSPNFDPLHRVKSKTENFKLIEKVFYLHAPDGIGKSKLAGGLDRLLGVEATSRNWNTVSKMIELSKELE